MSRAPPPWLEDFQRDFGRCLATPLEAVGGAWEARPDRYPLPLLAEVAPGPGLPAEAQLAAHNRQAWFRLYQALRQAYPLVTRLLGAWAFNHLARDFLLANPPQASTPAAAGLHLGAFLLANPQGVLPWEALAEAVAIDEAARRALEAPVERLLQGGAHRTGKRLVRAQAWTLLEEHWPLVELLARPADPERPQPLPPPCLAPQAWAIGGHGDTVGWLRLEPLQARLLELVGQLPLEEALGQLEAECEPAERAALPGQVQRWLQQGLELGLWAAQPP